MAILVLKYESELQQQEIQNANLKNELDRLQSGKLINIYFGVHGAAQ